MGRPAKALSGVTRTVGSNPTLSARTFPPGPLYCFRVTSPARPSRSARGVLGLPTPPFPAARVLPAPPTAPPRCRPGPSEGSTGAATEGDAQGSAVTPDGAADPINSRCRGHARRHSGPRELVRRRSGSSGCGLAEPGTGRCCPPSGSQLFGPRVLASPVDSSCPRGARAREPERVCGGCPLERSHRDERTSSS